MLRGRTTTSFGPSLPTGAVWTASKPPERHRRPVRDAVVRPAGTDHTLRLPANVGICRHRRWEGCRHQRGDTSARTEVEEDAQSVSVPTTRFDWLDQSVGEPGRPPPQPSGTPGRPRAGFAGSKQHRPGGGPHGYEARDAGRKADVTKSGSQ